MAEATAGGFPTRGICGRCGEPIEEESGDPAQRKPCPKCGSTSRVVTSRVVTSGGGMAQMEFGAPADARSTGQIESGGAIISKVRVPTEIRQDFVQQLWRRNRLLFIVYLFVVLIGAAASYFLQLWISVVATLSFDLIQFVIGVVALQSTVNIVRGGQYFPPHMIILSHLRRAAQKLRNTWPWRVD